MPLVIEKDTTYHAHPAWGKSRLWRYATMTPYAAEFGKMVRKTAFDIGHAAHTAILEPENFDDYVIRGPEDRKGHKWSIPYKEAEDAGKILLTESDYDLALLIRDVADTVPEIIQMRKGGIFERSCYAQDEETGAQVRTRPDCYNPDLKGMLDIKNLADISDDAWSRDIGKWGFHVQEAMYRDVWQKGSGMDAEFFFFVCFSKTEPVEVVCRQLEPVDYEEGFAMYRSLLSKAEAHRKAKHWPSFLSMSERKEKEDAGEMKPVRMRDRDRKFTPAQWKIDREALASEGDEYAE